MNEKTPPFALSDEEFHELSKDVRDLVMERTPNFETALGAMLSIVCGMAEAHLVGLKRWTPEAVIATRDFFTVNLLRCHDRRIAVEGGDPNEVRAEEVISVEALKRSGLVQ